MQTPDFIIKLDHDDVLADKQQEFLLPERTIYMDGNSLGPYTIAAQKQVLNVTQQQWQQDLVESWNTHSWIDLPISVGNKIAPIIGAECGQVICCDSISVNTFKLLSAALKLNSGRNLIVSEKCNFPTDLYIAQGLAAQLPQQCQLTMVDKHQILSSLTEDVAVLLLTHVDFRTGEMLDMRLITQKAHEKGVLVVWDLAHSAGALPLDLDKWHVDFAVGCGYKYLNGGPGSPAFVYVAKRHVEAIEQPLTGWMGHRAPFEFSPQYNAARGIEKMLCGTPAILSMAALNGALEVFNNVDMFTIRAKSNKLKQLFLTLLNKSGMTGKELVLITPTDIQQQGSQLSFSHDHAFSVSQALIAAGVIVDFRAPNIVRFGFTPLYLSFSDIYRASQKVCRVIETKAYRAPQFQIQKTVT